MNNRLNEIDVFRFLEHTLHYLRRKRSPCTVLNESNGSVLVLPLGQGLNKSTHERKNIRIISCCRKNELTVAESVLNGLRHIAACKIIDNNLRTAVCSELIGKDFNSLFRIAVNRGICNHNSLALDAV